ncbi:MAG: DegV family protein [Treponema sp.]|nr:DegV family protein [Treponema sp.]
MKYTYAIFADIASDLTSDLRDRFEVDGYLKGYMSTPEADDVEVRLDLSDAELDAFYASLKANKNGYKTAPLSIEEIVSYFETFLQQGKDILALCLSSKLSVMYNLLLRAKEIVCEKYPERKVFVVDSMKYSIAIGLLTIKACGFRAEGLTIEQNAEKLEKIKRTMHQMGSVDDLFWVASKGRISHSKAFFGTIAGVKAMGDFDADGMVTPLAKVSGYKKSHKAAVEYIKKTIKSANEQIIFVAHSARREQANILAAMIRENVKPKEVIVCNVQPTSGINVGPGLIAAFYFGTEITDLKFEKETINDIISKL